MPQTITIHHTLTDEFLSDIFHTASHRAIDYWGTITGGWDSGRIEYLEIEDNEDVAGAQFKVDQAALAAAIQKVLNGEVEVSERIRGYIQADVLNPDSTQIDSDAADVLIQVACFNEVVYG